MNLIDMLDLYAMVNDSDDLFLMLKDYTLDERISRDLMNKIIVKECLSTSCCSAFYIPTVIRIVPKVFLFIS